MDYTRETKVCIMLLLLTFKISLQTVPSAASVALKLSSAKTCCLTHNVSSLNSTICFPFTGDSVDLSNKEIQKVYNCSQDGIHVINIKMLYLDNNSISELEVDALSKSFPSLKSLTIWNNRLTSLKRKGNGRFQHMEILDVSQNQINYIMAGFLKIVPNLKQLNMQGNKLKYLPRGVFKELRYLTKIDMSFNLLKSINSDWFSRNDKLTDLILTNNQLLTWNPFDAHFIWPLSLKELNLSSNNLPAIPPLPTNNMDGEWHVDLRYNPIWCHCRLASHTENIVRRPVACGLWLYCQNGNGRVKPRPNIHQTCSSEQEEQRIAWLRDFTRNRICEPPLVTGFKVQENKIICQSTGNPVPQILLWIGQGEFRKNETEENSYDTSFEVIHENWSRNLTCEARNIFGSNLRSSQADRLPNDNSKFSFVFYSVVLNTLSLLFAIILSCCAFVTVWKTEEVFY